MWVLGPGPGVDDFYKVGRGASCLELPLALLGGFGARACMPSRKIWPFHALRFLQGCSQGGGGGGFWVLQNPSSPDKERFTKESTRMFKKLVH